jgi:hypothetical protein
VPKAQDGGHANFYRPWIEMEQQDLHLISHHCNMVVSIILCWGTVMNRVILRL